LGDETLFVGMVNGGGVVLCAGCTPRGRCAIGIRSERQDVAGLVTVDAECPGERQGIPGVAHGGWVADLFDEALGKALLLRGIFAVTESLEVRFLHPTPSLTPLRVTAHVERQPEGRWTVTGELFMAGSSVVLARGTARLVERNGEAHLERFQSWLQAERAVAAGEP
jgi:acyl-coenzyme A thioesterase PaaI-like protein